MVGRGGFFCPSEKETSLILGKFEGNNMSNRKKKLSLSPTHQKLKLVLAYDNASYEDVR